MARAIVGTVINHSLGECKLDIAWYGNGRLCIMAMCDDGQTMGKLTVNIPEVHLREGQYCIKTWSENEELARLCMETGLFEDTGIRIPQGMVEAQVWEKKEGVNLITK